MRSPLGKELRRQFKLMMKTQLPDYVEDKKQGVPQGWCVWTWQRAGNLYLHIVLVVYPTKDAFTIEGAWTRSGQLPYSLDSGFVEKNVILSNPYYFRIGYFIATQGDYSWRLVLRPDEYERPSMYKDDPIEDLLPLVEKNVADARNKIFEVIIPLYDEIARREMKDGNVRH